MHLTAVILRLRLNRLYMFYQSFEQEQFDKLHVKHKLKLRTKYNNERVEKGTTYFILHF